MTNARNDECPEWRMPGMPNARNAECGNGPNAESLWPEWRKVEKDTHKFKIKIIHAWNELVAYKFTS